MKRTIIYARVSTEDQVEKYGLPSQLRACRDFATPQDLRVIEEISDEGISGTTMDRPGLDRVRQLMREQAVDAVIALDPDRLSRELRHLLDIKAEADAARVALLFVTASFDNTPTGELFFSLKGSIAAYERKLFLERCLRGKRERARSGRIVGGRVCYGYRYDDGLLLIDEERAEWVRSIYGWYDSGLSMRAITLRLREMGAPTWGGRKWGHSSVQRILRNETFAGVAHYDSHNRTKKGHREPNPRDRWISLSVPALVSRAQWDRVQAKLNANPACGRPSPEYLLRGLLYCSCGRRMHGDTRRARNERNYRCYGRDVTMHQGERCNCTVNAKRADAAVWDAIVRAFSDTKTIRGMLAEHERRLRKTSPVDLSRMEAQARKLKAREERALSLMLDADMVDARQEIKRQYQEAQRERARIERDIEAARKAKTATEDRMEWLDATVRKLSVDLVEMTDPADRQNFVQTFVERADLSNGKIKLGCFIGRKLSITCSHSEQFPPIGFTLTARLAA